MKETCSVSNIYKLDGRVPIGKAIPFGLQHILAMFVANLAPIVAACVVTAIGFSLFAVGARSFGGGYAEDFGSYENLFLGTITLCVCLIWNIKAKGYLKQLSVLAGLIAGYIIAIFMGKVDLTVIMADGLISLPKFLPYMPKFHPGAIFSTCVIFLVSAAETIGDTLLMCDKEVIEV